MSPGRSPCSRGRSRLQRGTEEIVQDALAGRHGAAGRNPDFDAWVGPELAAVAVRCVEEIAYPEAERGEDV